MENAPVTAATGALGPVIAKLDALLGSEYKLRWRTRRDVKFITSKLKPMHFLLWNIWEREELDAASKALKMEALDLADDVDDTIVDFILSMENRCSNKRLIQTNFEASPFHDCRKRASDLSRRCRKNWKKPFSCGRIATSHPGKPRAFSFVRKDVSQLVRIFRPSSKLYKHLIGDYEMQFRTAIIYGIAGMGKTTLADLVYWEIGNDFQSRAFVSITPGDKITEVLARILEQVAPNTTVPLAAGTQAATQDDLVNIISNFLKDKRYLVIIDDIWNWRDWEVIMKSFPENNFGSRVLGTTRTVADKHKDSHGTNALIHEMLPTWCSGKGWVYRVDYENIAKRMVELKSDLVAEGFNKKHPIVRMCGGMPLAVSCMLSTVAQELEKQTHQGVHAKACDVQDEIERHVMENGIQNTPGFEPLVESLQLDFEGLPHHMLKSCLLYCSMYPDGHTFQYDDLVKRWISEGFVHSKEEACGYFDELIDRSLIMNKFGDLRMHSMMRNFLRWKSRQDNFNTCSSEITPSFSNTCRIRRLCIYNSPYRYGNVSALAALDWYHVRSLIIYKGIERVPFEKLEGLAVLDLLWTTDLLYDHWKDICGLVRLRHLLGVSGGRISEIPPEIVRLQCLETFEASGEDFARLPGFIGDLQKLKTLEMSYTPITMLPKEIGALKQLHTLRIPSASITELPREIGKLQQLNTLDIRGTEITVLPKEIGGLRQLKTLYINSTNITVLPKEIGELQQLKTLDMKHTKIKVLPKEIGKLQQLKTLDINHTEITALPKEIGKLQHLEHLFMTSTKVARMPREISGLKELKTIVWGESILAIPLEVCHASEFVKLPECIRQALNKSDLLSELESEMLSFQISGCLVIGAKQMHTPPWIREHFNNVAMLDIRICKLEEEGLKILREMPQLANLTLRFEVVPTTLIVFSSEGFAILDKLIVDSRVPRVTFQEGAMPMIKSLYFQFKFYSGPPNKDPMGINHLRTLMWIEFECNEDWYGGDNPWICPTIDVVRKEAKELTGMWGFKVCGHVEDIWSPLPSPPPSLEEEEEEEEEDDDDDDDDDDDEKEDEEKWNPFKLI